MSVTASSLLKSVVSQLESLEEAKRKIGDEIRDVLAHAKGEGLDTKVIKRVLKVRKMSPDELDEEEWLLRKYLQILDGKSGEALERDTADEREEAAA